MTQQSIKVLVVDDDRSWHVYLFSALQQDFILRSAYEGESVLQLVDEFQPDCILLDIYLPGRNGYELCHTLKQQPATAAIPVIMLSGKNTMQEKVQGFELGAEDYLVKSTEAEFLKAKIIRAVRQSRDRESLGKNLQLAQAVAFEAMSGSAELGHCIRFIERTYAMNSFALLAQGIFKTMDEFGLRASIMLQTPSAPLFFSASGQDISALEREMFIASHREGRFCDFGERSFCNFPAISLLVKNMPLEQPERYGRIKDALPWILGAADARVQQLIELGQAREHLGELQALAQGLQQHVQRAEAWPELSEEREQVIHEWAQQLEQLRALCDKAEACLSKPYRPSAEATAAEIHSRSVDLF